MLKEIVFCKDCYYRGDPIFCPMCHEEWNNYGDTDYDPIIFDYTKDDGFCHEGIIKDDEEKLYE